MGENRSTTSTGPRKTVTRIGDARRSASRSQAVVRAQAARRQLRSRQERFAHLKRMYD